ncbi:amino acid permease [Mycobacterium sp. CBMA293]|uniref:APC family permease n=1 Tax=unclassified Mycolicibacterium TaxID=2636767 RepID=UPI0012DC0BDB|nr:MULTISPECIES: amino acid permease [unclassified Mycolicibacterium]MUL47266.1 amino acid permease [Mycolicibacterium sp. CBMA 360]MUL61377.1 amino acid permease [Mycolicibacterium sp. CBMA 335]MUL72112.1 amino acid permease [Mycolicibacterium sp. CBMA 311]MUL96279.1 amino acid permease [Mycolicibacterium sp. CBMA 230]MUM08898.1 amino acid permease [Mycolicibacterium sp. CBMA 213]
MTTERVALPDTADEECIDCGYTPELKRTLGGFQVFAISFAFISVAVGIFGTYDDLLQTSGPVGIWLWVVAAVGQTLVALVVAQFASRIALSGSSYQWASRLANPKVGWLFGWLTFWYLAIAVVAMDNALASQALMPLLGISNNEDTARLITVAVLIIQAILVIASTRLLGMVTSGAVGLELGIVVLLVLALGIVMAVKGGGDVANLTTRGIAAGASDYYAIGGGLMAGMIMGLTTLVGFDSAANLAEEAKDPFKSVPRAIVASVVAAGLAGLIFLIALTLGIKDVAAVSHSGSPVALIIREQLGPVVERILLAGIAFAMFGAGMVVMAACSRQVFAMSRDARFPAHQMMRRVNPRTQTPVPATILILVVGVVLMVTLRGSALIQLIIASTILPALIYGAIVVLYLSVRKRLERKQGGFSLGRFEAPIAGVALAWVAVAVFVLVTPGSARVPSLIVLGLIAAGVGYFVKMLVFDREVLDTEPGIDEFAATPEAIQ